jgi:PIN domain nuclease of toxin-antitoxin system
MRLLLDTHVLLWALTDDPELSENVRSSIVYRKNEVFVSTASIWEISIKEAIGKLKTTENLLEFIAQARFIVLPIMANHAQLAGRLPMHHRDPFDRMLVAQAILDGLILVTKDGQLSAYQVPLFPW